MAVQLTREQAAVVRSRGGQLLVSAAAGSGKTFVLVRRLLDRVLREGHNLDEFLVITFTRAAATELRGKILAALREELSRNPGNAHLRRQATLVYRAQISTIHAFCARLLRESGGVLDLDPDFRLAEESETDLLRAQTLDRVLEEAYSDLEGSEFAALVDTLSAGRDDSRLREIVLDIHSRVQSHPDPERWLEEQAAAFRLEGITDAARTRWGALLLEDACERVRYWRGRMEEALELVLLDENLSAAYGENVRETLAGMDAFLAGAAEGWDAAAARAIPFTRLKPARKADPALKQRVTGIRDGCKKQMAKVAERFDSASAELLGDLAAVSGPVRELFRLVGRFGAAYQAAKARRRMLDFNDLEHLTVRALTGPGGAPTELALRWRRQFTEVLVDEYQDTNAVQNAIFDVLTDGGKTLFQVGDVKQSIYRFRLADPGIFLDKYARFPRGEEAAEGEPRTLVLSRNFRSRPSVLEAVNFVFEHIMTPEFGEIAYTDDQRLYAGGTFPDHPEDRTELDVIDLARLETGEDEASVPRDEAEANFVARRVRELLDEGFPVTEGDTLRPARPEDIAILHRSPGKALRYLTLALDREQVPWQLAGDEDFFSSTEVRVALSFLQIVDNPREDVPLIAVLRSPVCGFTGDQLALLRANCREGDFYTCLRHGAERGDGESAAFLARLEELRLLAPDLTAPQLLWRIYDRTGLLGIFGAMPGGQRRQENLLAFYDYACACQRAGRGSLFAFVRDLRQSLERGGRLPGVPGRQGSGVHILSIHKSKGLEYPVVVLAGLARQVNRADERAPMLFHQTLGVGPRGLDPELRVEFPTLARQAVQLQLEREMKAEELRLLYVAMTRAKDKLILTMCLTNAEKTLARLAEQAGPHPDPQALLRRDTVGEWLLLPVLARRDAGELWTDGAPETLIDPPDRWDIRLCAPVEAAGPAERVPAEEEAPAERADLDWLDWTYPDGMLADLPSKLTATQMKGRALDAEAAEETPPRPVELSFHRPRFEQRERGLTPAQRGTATHCVMERIDPERAADPACVAGEVERLVAGGWLTEREGAAVDPERIAAFWASDPGRAARSAPDLRREFKFSLLLPARDYRPDAPEGETILVQGVVDCCFETEEGLTVIDFKTDRVTERTVAERAEYYRGQVELYSRALEELTGKPVTRKILWFFALDKEIQL